MVTEWTQARTTQEIVDLAVAFRIPVAPIAHPGHTADRRPLSSSAECSSNPKPVYCSRGCRIAARRSRPDRPDGRRCWAPTTVACTGRAEARATVLPPHSLPLSDIRITDFTAFWAGPVATQLLGALGADVIKLEGVRRPDGMRFSAARPPGWDQWWEWGPVFLCSNNNKRGISVELGTEAGRALALELIAASDLVIENFSPRVMANFGLEWDTVEAANPRAVMVRMPAFGLDGPWRDRVGFAQTMEQSTGMAWMTGHADGPPVIPRGVCDPIAGLHAAFAAIAALVIRDRDGIGVHVESTMVESALNVAAEMLVEYSRNGIELRRNGNRGPGASPQGVYPCQGDDEWVALAALDDAARASLARPDRRIRAGTSTNRQTDLGLDHAALGCRRGRRVPRMWRRRSTSRAARGPAERTASARPRFLGNGRPSRRRFVPVHRYALRVRRQTTALDAPGGAAVRPAHQRGACSTSWGTASRTWLSCAIRAPPAPGRRGL